MHLSRPWTDAPVFFRPTPYGFRQVVQHVSKHVAYEINQLIQQGPSMLHMRLIHVVKL